MYCWVIASSESCAAISEVLSAQHGREATFLAGIATGFPSRTRHLRPFKSMCVLFTSGRWLLHNATARIIAQLCRKKYGLLQTQPLFKP